LGLGFTATNTATTAATATATVAADWLCAAQLAAAVRGEGAAATARTAALYLP